MKKLEEIFDLIEKKIKEDFEERQKKRSYKVSVDDVSAKDISTLHRFKLLARKYKVL